MLDMYWKSTYNSELICCWLLLTSGKSEGDFAIKLGWNDGLSENFPGKYYDNFVFLE